MSTSSVVEEELFTNGFYSAILDDVFDTRETDENLTPRKLCGCVAVEIDQFTGALMTLSR